MIEHKLYQEDLEQINHIDIPWSLLEGKSILITGASGLIGSVLVDALIYRNEEMNANITIWVLGRKEATLRERFGKYFDKKYFHFMIQDVSIKISVASPIDYIIHGASKGDPHSFATDPVGVMNANYMGMYQVLELAKEKSAQKVIYISSGEVYGIIDNKDSHQLNSGFIETDHGYLDILNVRACYASSKRAAETLCAAYHHQFNLDVSIVRPCHTYGASMLKTDNRVIGEFIRNAKDKTNIIMKSQGQQKRSYCYVSDTVSAILFILLKGVALEAYNIANKKSIISIVELAEFIAKFYEVKIAYELPKEIEEKGYSNIMHAILDATKMEALGWKPRIGIFEGIGRVQEIINETENKN